MFKLVKTRRKDLYIVSWNCHGKLDLIDLSIDFSIYDFIHLSETHHGKNSVIKNRNDFKPRF